MEKLEHNIWKGNIRELRNVIERSVILSDENVINIDTLPTEIQYPEIELLDTNMPLADIEKMYIKKILDYTKGNKTEAAGILKIGIATLYRKIEEYQIFLNP